MPSKRALERLERRNRHKAAAVAAPAAEEETRQETQDVPKQPENPVQSTEEPVKGQAPSPPEAKRIEVRENKEVAPPVERKPSIPRETGAISKEEKEDLDKVMMLVRFRNMLDTFGKTRDEILADDVIEEQDEEKEEEENLYDRIMKARETKQERPGGLDRQKTIIDLYQFVRPDIGAMRRPKTSLGLSRPNRARTPASGSMSARTPRRPEYRRGVTMGHFGRPESPRTQPIGNDFSKQNLPATNPRVASGADGTQQNGDSPERARRSPKDTRRRAKSSKGRRTESDPQSNPNSGTTTFIENETKQTSKSKPRRGLSALFRKARGHSSNKVGKLDTPEKKPDSVVISMDDKSTKPLSSRWVNVLDATTKHQRVSDTEVTKVYIERWKMKSRTSTFVFQMNQEAS